MDARQDELIRIYSKASTMLRNANHPTALPLELGEEFDSLVQRASDCLKQDLSEFKIGKSYLTTNRAHHQPRPFKGRMDAFAGYIAAYLPGPVKERIGFPHGTAEQIFGAMDLVR